MLCVKNIAKFDLWAARIPGLAGFLADHYLFLVWHNFNGQYHQTCDQLGSLATFWLEWFLLGAPAWEPFGPLSGLCQRTIWINAEMYRRWGIVDIIESSPRNYPFLETYRYWPGPNSNTLAQWVVQDQMVLGIRAIGKSLPVPDMAWSA